MVREMDRIKEAEKVTIWIVTDNYFDTLRPDSTIASRYRITPGKSIHAEHGLAYYIETVVDGKTNACTFDYGLDPKGVMNNMSLLGIDLGRAMALGLSHGHFDHCHGVIEILEANRAEIRRGTPFYAGEEAFCRRFLLPPGKAETMDLGQLRKEDLEAFGLKVVEVTNSTEFIPGAYFTGNIERITSYEKNNPSLLIKRGETTEVDDFRGEQALFFKVKGKGLILLSGCAHPGIVNTVKQAQKVSGVERIHAIIGGFHLVGAASEKIWQTVADIKAMNPDYIVPTHCTGFEALGVFSAEMPAEFILNTAGTKYTFTA
jgi:7,8-dihydropterin-6-yl-methyl-4-(beta-D-ribofuranosyl)aminobenzene 5'-phosphate synthase